MNDALLPVLRDTPGSATVLPLLDCNARCPFCSTRVYTPEGVLSPVDWRAGVARRAKDYTLSLDALRGLYDGLLRDGVRRVNLQGGEPTLHEGLCELIEYGWTKGFEEQTVVTNGRRLADADFTRRLVQTRPTTIVLSVFGAEASVHDESMGVRGAFDDLTRGVEHLLSAGAGRPGATPSVLAQFTLHAFNFQTLPDMLSFWHARGLRDFAVRLLRETDNTNRDERRWFFDLAKLEGPLLQALDFAAAHPGTSFGFAELHRCLLPASQLPRVLLDVGSNPNLQREHVQVARHFEVRVHGRNAEPGQTACERCELADGCVKPEAVWAQAFSGALRAVDVDAELTRLGADALPSASVPGVAALLNASSAFGVEARHRRALRGRLVEAARTDGAEALCRALFSERLRVDTAQRLRPYGRERLALRFVSFVRARINEVLDEQRDACLARVGDSAVRGALSRLTFIAAEPHVGIWVHAAGAKLVVTVVHDSESVGEEDLEVALGWLMDSPAVR